MGSGVTGFRGGDAVIGLSDRLALPLKAQAEYVVLDADAVAAVPVGTDPVAEAVGGYAVRLAALAGVRVVAVAGAGDEELVRDLGAKFFVPRTADLPAATDASSGSPGSWVRGLGRDGRGGSGDGHPRAESCRL
ncbi:hypothetical protein C7M71_030215 [Peterkaempfera bronchialis]|uniref:Uncharacterized protein n=1 Tax=Peterkaempfera bronchialis TaxID=2126346 RepID=A0A345T4W7_9ACTN|nr:hypothetical protein [Peterkaempfera bronchialis]AXI81022.1 hypothetical protein C7M71_030215 [Peterkaempfera bronchialis]